MEEKCKLIGSPGLSATDLDIKCYNFLRCREIGFPTRVLNRSLLRRGKIQNPHILKQRQFDLGDMNKIFCSQWLSDNQVIFGTKCNKLIVQDVSSGKRWQVPSLPSRSRYSPCACGVHSIQLNPSGTLLATGAENVNDLAVYRAPTLDPIAVGEGGHADWIFDLKWLDDEYVVTGSRDSSICLWRVDESVIAGADESRLLDVHSPLSVQPRHSVCDQSKDKIRALAFNRQSQHLAALSLNARLFIYDINTLKLVRSIELMHKKENVCMAFCDRTNKYAIGSSSHITMFDGRSAQKVQVIMSEQRGNGVRSVSLQDEMVTYGTGAGCLYFHDLRRGRHVECHCGHTCCLVAGQGYVRPDYQLPQLDIPHAIYTHQYDNSGLRIFTAGGPLAANSYGNYAGVWY